jgi:hypothetical protein
MKNNSLKDEDDNLYGIAFRICLPLETIPMTQGYKEGWMLHRWYKTRRIRDYYFDRFMLKDREKYRKVDRNPTGSWSGAS